MQRGMELKPLFLAGAHSTGKRVAITYISYQGPSKLTKAQAQAYLRYLDQGGTRRHHSDLSI